MKMNTDYFYRGRNHYRYSGFWFGLVRIAESSKYGTHLLFYNYTFYNIHLNP